MKFLDFGKFFDRVTKKCVDTISLGSSDMRPHLDRVGEGGGVLVEAELHQPVQLLLVVDVEGNLQSLDVLQQLSHAVTTNT